MTREEEMIIESQKRYDDIAFLDGVKWADEHPKSKTIAEYLYKEKGYPISLNGDIPTYEEVVKHVQTYNNYKMRQRLEKQGEQEEPQVYETEDGNIITYSETDGYKFVEPNFHENERAWLYLVSDVLTWKEGIGQYLDDPEVQELAKRLCSEYSQKLYYPSNSSNIGKE